MKLKGNPFPGFENHYMSYMSGDDAELKAAREAQAKDLFGYTLPEGMTMDSAAGYEVTIRHLTDAGVEVFSMQDGSIALTPNGFSVSVSSLSPFEVSWTAPATASLPLTGDAAPLGWYGALMALSALAIACLRRHRKA